MKPLFRVSLVALTIGPVAAALGCSESPSSAAAAIPSEASSRSKAMAPAPTAPPASPAQTVEMVAHGLGQGRPHVLWDALPPSYQRDVTEIVHSFAGNVDRDIWNKSFAIIRKVGTVMQNQKATILAMPKFREEEGFDLDRLSRDWDHVVAPIMTLANSELAHIESLQRIDVRQFLHTSGATLMSDIVRVSELSPSTKPSALGSLTKTRAEVVSWSGDEAEVRISRPGVADRTEQMVRVEGRWIPREIAQDWDKEMAEAREHIAQMSGQKMQAAKPQIMEMLAGIDATLDQLDQAATPEQFEQTLQMGMFQVFGGIMAIAQAVEPERTH